jgi:hypothetical protein
MVGFGRDFEQQFCQDQQTYIIRTTFPCSIKCVMFLLNILHSAFNVPTPKTFNIQLNPFNTTCRLLPIHLPGRASCAPAGPALHTTQPVCRGHLHIDVDKTGASSPRRRWDLLRPAASPSSRIKQPLQHLQQVRLPQLRCGDHDVFKALQGIDLLRRVGGPRREDGHRWNQPVDPAVALAMLRLAAWVDAEGGVGLLPN